jgi:hypothetical protein
VAVCLDRGQAQLRQFMYIRKGEACEKRNGRSGIGIGAVRGCAKKKVTLWSRVEVLAVMGQRARQEIAMKREWKREKCGTRTYGSAALARSIARSSSGGSLSAGSIVGDRARTTTCEVGANVR